jgi:hypothetical protein
MFENVLMSAHSGWVVDNRPMALEHWRIATGEKVLASKACEVFGGRIERADSSSGSNLSVFTQVSTLPIIVNGVTAVRSEMKMWNASKLVHHCDGFALLAPDEMVGRKCGCPETLPERKQAARDYRGPSPSIRIEFRIAGMEGFGLCSFQTGSWVLKEGIDHSIGELREVGGLAQCELRLARTELRTKAGRGVCYMKPIFAVLGPITYARV